MNQLLKCIKQPVKYIRYFLYRIRQLVNSSLPDYWYTVFRYRQKFGRWPNLRSPKTFSEKLNYKKLYCRDPLLTTLEDKYAVRQYVQEKVGGKYQTKLYLLADNAEDIDFSKLPDRFVIKTTHGCGWNIIVKDKSEVDVLAVKQQLAQWLRLNYYKAGREWPYKNIQPRIIIEEFLGDQSGKVPYDYKMFCFNGVVKLIMVVSDRFINPKANFYDRDWKRLDTKGRWWDTFDFPLPSPTNHGRMVVVAEVLSAGLDFMRVDLYNTNNRIYFGEMEPYPANGFQRFDPPEFDAVLGTYWVGMANYKSRIR